MSFSKLTWGVKASFRSYVEAVGGTVTLGDGATRAEDGSFVFTAVPGGDLSIAPDGTATGLTYDCYGWTTSDGSRQGTRGSAQVTSESWTWQSHGDCDVAAHLYCFQQ